MHSTDRQSHSEGDDAQHCELQKEAAAAAVSE